jgi:homocysteine S-methyltransferase
MSFEGFSTHGIPREEASRLMIRSTQLAREARDQVLSRVPPSRLRPLVVASVGTYAAHLADGSEYTGALGLSAAQLEVWHRDKFQILANSGADALACETVPCVAEARALARLLAEWPSADHHGCPGAVARCEHGVGAVDIASSWLSLACRSSRDEWGTSGQLVLNSGESLEDAVRAIEDLHGAAGSRFGVGVNCMDPRITQRLVEDVRDLCHPDRLVVVYPNSGELWDSARACWCPSHCGGADFCSEDGSSVAAMVRGWREAGANVIGSCCRTGPETTRRIRSALLQPIAVA